MFKREFYVSSKRVRTRFQTNNLLSFPPEAKYWLSGDHFRPHTS